MMLIAASQLAGETFFPPWYFWLFVLAVVAVIFTGLATIVYFVVSAETQRQQHARETSARLLEVMIVQRKMSADEIEQVLSSYYRSGTIWSRINCWFKRRDDLPNAARLGSLLTKPVKLPN